MRMKKFAVAVMLLVICFAGSFPCYAAEELYMAGAPEAWPFEYYDRKEGTFRGILPEILSLGGESCGISIRYLPESGKDDRLKLAKNIQVDAIFTENLSREAVEKSGLEYGPEIYAYTEEGETKRIFLAYAESFPPASRSALEQAVSELSEEQIRGVVLRYAGEKPNGAVWSPMREAATWVFRLCIAGVFLLLPYLWLREKRRIEELAYTDDITGGSNLAVWKQRFTKEIRDENRQAYAVLYLYTGMDMVSHINGYEEAARAMKLLSDICLEWIDPKTEGMARFNEFCFVFFVRYTSVDRIRERLGDLRGEISDALVKRKKKYFAEIRTGIYLLGSRDTDPLLTIQYSEVAMEYARIHALDCAVYNEYVERETITSYMMEHEAVHGLLNQEFIVYLQPMVDSRTGEICGAETLVRWANPARGLLKPGEFMQALKRKHLIGKMNMEIYSQGCELMQYEKRQGRKLRMMFNFTAENIGDELFPAHMDAIAEQYGIDRDQVVVQLNQIVEMSQAERCSDVIRKLRGLGFHVCLAGLELDRVFLQFLECGADGIKLRQDLVSRIETEEGRKVIEGIIAICRSLKLEVFAVGIENEAQADRLAELGCFTVSGYYYYYPLGRDEFAGLLKEKKKENGEV